MRTALQETETLKSKLINIKKESNTLSAKLAEEEKRRVAAEENLVTFKANFAEEGRKLNDVKKENETLKVRLAEDAKKIAAARGNTLSECLKFSCCFWFQNNGILLCVV